MKVSGVVDNWRYKQHGPRQQTQVISYLLDRLCYLESVGHNVPLTRLIKECQSKFNVSCSVIRKWWKNYEQYGELYYETMAHLQSMTPKKSQD